MSDPYYSIKDAYKNVKNSDGAADTAVNTLSFLGKTVFNVARFAVTEALPSMLETQSKELEKKSKDVLKDNNSTEEQRETANKAKVLAEKNRENADKIREKYKTGKYEQKEIQEERTVIAEVEPESPEIERELIGSVFIQCNTVGLASYHFDSQDDVYISYENAPNWKLDNGNKPPKKKHFINTSFDFENKVFRGTIDWSTPEKTTFVGNKKWIYEIEFSENYENISGGSITSINSNDEEEGKILYFEVDLFYEVLD